MRYLPGVLLLAALGVHAQDRLIRAEGKASFASDAPLELIQASSNELRGVVNTEENTFAFTIPTSTFQGFNNGLQREHFNENYLESKTYPSATFKGRFIDPLPLNEPGRHIVRAKGLLNIHGVERERIIKCTLVVDKSGVLLLSDFTVLLVDHNITIPRVVYHKIAEEIRITVNLRLHP